MRDEGYRGAYDSVQRHVREWRRQKSQQGPVFIPLWFAPGAAYQFDWSHEVVVLGGVTTSVKSLPRRRPGSPTSGCVPAACRFCEPIRAKPFDAHEHALRLFGGMARRGIYDNMPIAVDAVFVGKQRRFNRRFLRMCSHYLVEPVACTPRVEPVG